MFETSLRMFAATLIAPLTAPLSVILAIAVQEGSPSTALFAPLMLVMLPGIYGFALAFIPVLLLGAGLTVAALHFPALRPKRIWLATGASFGTLIGLVFVANGWDMLVYGAIAGSASALTYRLIVGAAFRGPVAVVAEAAPTR